MKHPGEIVPLTTWLTAAQFAEAMEIGPRSAQRILAGAMAGTTWCGVQLDVRAVEGRGGRGGVNYQVAESSLPARDTVRPPAPARKPRNRPDNRTAERLDIITPALQARRGSPERAVAIEAAQRTAGVSQATIYEWIAAYEAKGVGGLVSKPNKDKGKPRVQVSRAWDRAVPFDDATRARIAASTRRYCNSCWRSAGIEMGYRAIERLVSDHLQTLTLEAGFEGSAKTLKRICKLPMTFIKKDWRRFRNVAIYDQNRKQWEDMTKPRTQRTRLTRKPLEVVVCDVHPMDVILPRLNGSTFTAKLIGFEDWATARVFLYPVYLGPGEGVRMEHVAAGLVAMMCDPEWGVPEHLYIDNGGEYNIVDQLAELMSLASQIRTIVEDGRTLADAVRAEDTTITARPYNAAAKSIERTFASLERIFSNLPGHIGGNRMAKKTANVGRAPQPYPHGRKQFEKDVKTSVAFYNSNPRTQGELKGRSPNDLYAAHVDQGWCPVRVTTPDALAIFARDESRICKQCAFTWKGQTYTAPELSGIPHGTRLHIRVPVFSNAPGIIVMDGKNKALCMARPQRRFDILDRAGAEESGSRTKAARKAVRSARAETDQIDIPGALERLTSKESTANAPGAIGPVRIEAGMAAIGRDMVKTPKQIEAERQEKDRLARNNRLELHEIWKANMKTGTDE